MRELTLVASCPRCGRSFRCGAKDEWCWCERLSLDALPPGALDGFEGCLCRDCLVELGGSPVG